MIVSRPATYLGKDLLGLRRKNDNATYWHQVDPAARSPMKNQF